MGVRGGVDGKGNEWCLGLEGEKCLLRWLISDLSVA